MSSGLVMDLVDAFDVLQSACKNIAEAIRDDGQQGLPLLLPAYHGELGGEREAAIQAITQLWHLKLGEQLPNAGLLCVSAPTLEAAELLKDAKKSFKEAVVMLREKSNVTCGEKNRIDKLIELVLNKEESNNNSIKRDEDLSLALKRIGASDLDLLRCYANVRVLPTKLESISWTWATTHSAIKPVSSKEAEAMANKLPDKSKKYAFKLLANLKGESLAYKKNLPNQLRANLVFSENGERKRKAVTISGIVLNPDNKLPRYVWRDDPDQIEGGQASARLSRHDLQIDPKPYIKSLNLHLYLKKNK